MIRSFFPTLLTAVLLLGCSSLPNHPETTGVVVLPLQLDNTSAQPEPIHKIDLLLSNGHTFNFVPRSGKALVPVSEAGLSIVGVRVSLRLEHWSGADHTSAVNIPLDAAPGTIRILPWTFRYQQENWPGKSGSFYGHWNLIPVNLETAEKVKASLEADPEFSRWSVAP